MNLVFHIFEDDFEIELKHCASLKASVKSARKCFVHLNWIDSLPIPVGSIAQLVEWRFRNPKMRVQIPLETTNFSLSFAVSD